MEVNMISQKSYLIKAIYEWCVDNSLTPFLATAVDAITSVPEQYVQNGQIILNLSLAATTNLLIDVEWITFNATFGGIMHNVSVPIHNVIAIFAQENGQGMQFNIDAKPSNEKAQEVKKPAGSLRLVK